MHDDDFQAGLNYYTDTSVPQADKDRWLATPLGQEFAQAYQDRAPQTNERTDNGSNEISPTHSMQTAPSEPVTPRFRPGEPPAETVLDPIQQARDSWGFEDPKNAYQAFCQKVLIGVSRASDDALKYTGSYKPYVATGIQGAPQQVVGVVDSMLTLASQIYPDNPDYKTGAIGGLAYSSVKIMYDAFVDLAKGDLRKNSVKQSLHLTGNALNIAGLWSQNPIIPMAGGIAHAAADRFGGLVSQMVQAHREVQHIKQHGRRNAINPTEGQELSRRSQPWDPRASGSVSAHADPQPAPPPSPYAAARQQPATARGLRR